MCSEFLKFVGIHSSVKFNFTLSIALPCNSQVTSSKLRHLFIETVQVGSQFFYPLVVSVLKHLSRLQLENLGHTFLKRSLKLLSFLHIMRRFLNDLAKLSCLNFCVSLYYSTLRTYLFQFGNQLVDFRSVRISVIRFSQTRDVIRSDL